MIRVGGSVPLLGGGFPFSPPPLAGTGSGFPTGGGGGGGGGGSSTLTLRRGRDSLLSYGDIGQLVGWLGGSRLQGVSFYTNPDYSPDYTAANGVRDQDPSHYSQDIMFALNEPGAAGYSDATSRNRAMANGSADGAIRSYAYACGTALANNPNLRYVVWMINEYQTGWNRGYGGYDVPAWIGKVQRCYTIGHEVLGNQLILALCPTHNYDPRRDGYSGAPYRWADWYPGDAYCDAIGCTLYSTLRYKYDGNTQLYGDTVQDQLLDPRNEWGPSGLSVFAENHGKFFYISEYGPLWNPSIGQSPGSAYDAEQANFFQYTFDAYLGSNNCIGVCFFNEWSGDGYHKLDNLPQARAKLIQLYG